MSTSQQSGLSVIITIVVLMLTAFQGMIPAMPIDNPATITKISAITMFIVTGLTYIKNHIFDAIGRTAQKATHLFLAIAMLGLVNEYIDFISFSEKTAQWLRFGLTAAVTMLNVLAKYLFPNHEQKR